MNLDQTLVHIYLTLFWENKEKTDICSEITGIRSTFWTNEVSLHECENLLLQKAYFWLYLLSLSYSCYYVHKILEKCVYWGFNRVFKFAKSYLRQVGRQPISAEQNSKPLLHNGRLCEFLPMQVPDNELYRLPGGQ